MNDISCPHCGQAFKIDESGYVDILKQVRNQEFEHEIHERLELAAKETASAVELAKSQLKAEWQGEQAKRDAELQREQARREAEIQALKAKLDATQTERQLAVAQAVSDIEKQKEALANKLERAALEKELS